MARRDAALRGPTDDDGLSLQGPRMAGDIDMAQNPMGFEKDTTMRSVAFDLGGAPSAVFPPALQTQFRSAVVSGRVAEALGGMPGAAVPMKLRSGADFAKDGVAAAVLPVVRALPQSPLFALEPRSHFRVHLVSARKASEAVAAALRDTPHLGSEVDEAGGRWRCVLSSVYGHVAFDVSVYADGFHKDGKPVFVVEAQRRAGCAAAFFTSYKCIRNAVLAEATPMRRTPPQFGPRVMPLPPKALLTSVGGDARDMALAAFRDTLALEAGATLHETKLYAVASLAEQTADAAARGALATEGRLLREVVLRLLQLARHANDRIASFAALALAELSEVHGAREVLVNAGAVPELSQALVNAMSLERVGLRRGCASVLRNCASAQLNPLDRKVVEQFAREGAATGDHVLSSLASEAGRALEATG